MSELLCVEGGGDSSGKRREQTVYLLAREDIDRPVSAPVSFVDVWRILWMGKWIIVTSAAAFAALAVVYALTATEWYRAEAILAPVSSSSDRGLSGRLGGLASLAGLAGLGLEGNDSAEALALLQSDGFTRAFIEQQNLVPMLFADKWDASAGKWRVADPSRVPDIEDAVDLFDKQLRYVQVSRNSGLVTLAVEWKDAELAARWVNLLVEQLNSRMRERALSEADANVRYLREALAGESAVVLQQSIGRLLESELQKLMIARGKQEFSFSVIDRAVPSKWRLRPKRTQIVVIATAFGGMVGIFAVFLRLSVLRDLQKHRPLP